MRMVTSWLERIESFGREALEFVEGDDKDRSSSRTRSPGRRGLPRLTVSNLLVFGAVFGAGFLAPVVGPGFVPADLFILAMIAIWIPSLPRGEPHGVLQRLVIPIALIFAGSLLGTMTVGIRPWIVTDLVKDVGSFATFLAIITILRVGGPSVMKAAGWAAGLATVLVCGALIFDVGTRAQATFANPNIAAHFLVTNLVVITRAPVPSWLRYTTLGLGIVGLAVTGSFGALLMSIGAFGYLLMSLPAGQKRLFVKRLAILAVVLLGVAMVGFVGGELAQEADTGFNERHLERSSEGRLGKWAAAIDVALDNPLGIGPGSNRGLGLLPGKQEAHNEYVAYVTERSLIGFIGLILLYLALWRIGPRGGLTRALVIGFALQSLVRETFHYRHLWIILGVAVVLDEHRLAKSEAHDRPAANRVVI